MEDAQSYLDRPPSTRVDDKELAALREAAAILEWIEQKLRQGWHFSIIGREKDNKSIKIFLEDEVEKREYMLDDAPTLRAAVLDAMKAEKKGG